MKLCCWNCFTDRAISEKIQRNGFLGRCDFCRSDNALCIDPESLSDLLEWVVECFEKSDDGEPPHIIFERDFCIFSQAIKEPEALLHAILGNNLSNQTYKLKYDTRRYSAEWSLFKEELIGKNRFFPRTSIYADIFSTEKISDIRDPFNSIVEQLSSYRNEGEEFFRARISSDPLSRFEMGRPPAKVASSGRANPTGISYLYLAENIETCLHEVRPSNSADVYVSKVLVKDQLKLADLTSPKLKVSVLKFEEEEINLVLKHLNLLELFSADLSRPIQPENSHLEYLPTQFLCEYLRVMGGFDGIIFSSSFATGNNVVLFEEKRVAISDPVRHKILKISIEYKEH